MCFPVIGAVLGLAVSAISTVATIETQQKQFAQQKAQYDQNYANALSADRNNQQQLTLRQEQEQGQTAQKIHDQGIQAAQKEAQISVSAAGGNVAGLSVDNLISDVNRQLDMNTGILNQNYKNTAAQLQAQKDASVDQAQSRIQGMAVPIETSPVGAIAGLAGSGFKAIGQIDSGTNISSAMM